jgi:hypothetical protein
VAERFEIPPERRNRIAVQKMTKDKDYFVKYARLRKACVPRALAMPLTSDRWTQPYYSARLISAGQFRTADGLVLLGGGALGPQMSRRSLAR